jgi:uncharacterized protein
VSQENVEIVRRGLDAWNAGDMDQVRDFYDPNIVMQTVPDWPEPGPYVGREAVIGFFMAARGSLDSDAVEPTADFIAVADHVLVRHTWRGLGHGPELNLATTLIFTLRRGKVIHLEYFWDHDEALKAVGLED